MGARGRIPKRNEDRGDVSHKDRQLSEVEIATSPAIQPPPDPLWCVAAQRIWQSMGASGQTRFYEASDWAFAQFTMDEITRYVEGGKQSGIMLSAIDSMLVRLMLTEGDRRRAGIELQRAGEDDSVLKRETQNKWVQKTSSLKSI